MCMLAVARKTDERFRLEIDLQSIEAENLTYKGANEKLIVRRLHSVVELPIDLDLFADMRHAAILIDLCLQSADFLMPHLHVETIFVKLDKAVLERRAHSPVRPLPILLVHHL